MASNTKMTPLKEEVLEKESPEIRPDSPLLDLSDAAIKKLIRSRLFPDQKRGARGGPPLPAAPEIVRGFIGSKPSRCSFLRASLRARRTASAFSRTLLSDGFS